MSTSTWDNVHQGEELQRLGHAVAELEQKEKELESKTRDCLIALEARE